MKVILAGGSGQVGRALARAYNLRGWSITTFGRGDSLEGRVDRERYCRWDGQTLADWAKEVDGADIVINLAGRSVNCRYSDENLRLMMDSRVNSARAIGMAIAQAESPPKLWLQMSTATIYAHRFEGANDDASGIIGGEEPGIPDYWSYSVQIAKNWEHELTAANTPHTRRVALRASMIMGPARGGIFDTLYQLTRFRLGGSVAGGNQFVSWIHEDDFIAALDFILEHESIEGPIIVASPNPMPQGAFMRALREAMGIGLGLPATKWMATIGAFFMRTDTELILKSPARDAQSPPRRGFSFRAPRLARSRQALGRGPTGPQRGRGMSTLRRISPQALLLEQLDLRANVSWTSAVAKVR